MKPTSMTLCLASLLLPSAQAAEQIYAFNYSSPTGAVISGQLQGALQADLNAILVSAIVGTPRFNGTPAVALPFVDAIVDVAARTSYRPAIVSLDGTLMDFAACTDASCNDGFGFESSGLFGYPFAIGLTSFGNIQYEPYTPAAWRISAVPEIPTALLMALGLGWLCARGRRRAG